MEKSKIIRGLTDFFKPNKAKIFVFFLMILFFVYMFFSYGLNMTHLGLTIRFYILSFYIWPYISLASLTLFKFNVLIHSLIYVMIVMLNLFYIYVLSCIFSVFIRKIKISFKMAFLMFLLIPEYSL